MPILGRASRCQVARTILPRYQRSITQQQLRQSLLPAATMITVWMFILGTRPIYTNTCRPRSSPHACLACGSPAAVPRTAVPKAAALASRPHCAFAGRHRHRECTSATYDHRLRHRQELLAPGLQPRRCLKSYGFGFHPSEYGCENNRAKRWYQAPRPASTPRPCAFLLPSCVCRHTRSKG